jgi:NAD-dependent dihydropyrimidine dehydrogenase PreA subunit
MKDDQKIYRALQQHLDRQAVGFPATRSGAEIRILRHIFSPAQAEVATCLSFRPEPIEVIYQRARNLVESVDELADLLDAIEKNGGLESGFRQEVKHYSLAPLVVGMYEFQLGRLTPEFIRDFKEYTSSISFGLAFLSTELPQMRTIPIAKSIPIQSHVSTFDEAEALLKGANNNFAICECICRTKKSLANEPCSMTDRKETCLALGEFARTAARIGMGRKIDMKEALSILEKNQAEGLVLQPSNTQDADFICSCCGCCCGMLGIHTSLPKPLDFWTSNFYARIDADLCNGCGICEKRCQVGAVRVGKKTRKAGIDLNRCIGCGLCVTACPQKAVSLEKKTGQTTPPQTREELYDIIMDNKKGKLGKLKLTGKLLKDALVNRVG